LNAERARNYVTGQPINTLANGFSIGKWTVNAGVTLEATTTATIYTIDTPFVATMTWSDGSTT